MKIYVVDSDEGTRSMLLYVLGEQSYTASGFETADSFKAALRTELPNLILLDSVMTEKEDGLSLLKWLKADRHTASIPVILLMEKATEMARMTICPSRSGFWSCCRACTPFCGGRNSPRSGNRSRSACVRT